MLLLDLTHTSHTRARTGIQRVARALWRQLGANAMPVTRDPFLGGWRPLEPWELANLASTQGSERRHARWPWSAKWRSRFRRILRRNAPHLLTGNFTGSIEPELFSPVVGRELPRVFARVRGPRVALFHDAISLRLPELTPPAMVARLPGYLHELLQFDGIAAISEDSRDSLLGYWRWLGVPDTPPVIALPLGVDPSPAGVDRAPPSSAAPPVILSVGTLEGRKNHLALFAACEMLWVAGVAFTLRVIGHADAPTGGAALERIRALQASGRPVRYDGPADDPTIAAAYDECAFTVYPSLAEGFGLPVIESLARGRPCICLGRGALGEISRAGGCVPLDNVEPPTLAQAIRRLLESPSELQALSATASARRFNDWATYTAELTDWIATLRRRNSV
ncbi:glycosyltransferase [Opitutus terrae]|uniref:Glycosyl transferase group 1 n=1 Tax=Opitutus terrae (strain DSM 11246 / JCM 15787 / PB90-1) TaxID=452637 RepID=B1ZZU4_OPITP|nr:glycosyltransferase [Opitutus terrae]ACB77280.1 glycosyl transferase group 1 [Opitutus terrae PB90-1]